MASNPSDVKRRIESTYERDDRTVDDGTDHVGQMTIAFCAGDYQSDTNQDLY